MLDQAAQLRAFLYSRGNEKTCLVSLDSPFVRRLVEGYFNERPWKWNLHTKRRRGVVYDLQFCEYEELDWDSVLTGESRSRACCYCVRKGMTRKAAWAQVVNKYVDKHGKDSVLGRFVPETLVISTWDAFNGDGGWLKKFGVHDKQIALNECLYDARECFPGQFVLKPSIASKGSEVTTVRSFEQVKQVVCEWEDCSEWVLQRYVPNLLLLNGGRKFHLRVFIVCVGALRVHVFQQYIAFFATEAHDKDGHYSHITNACQQRDHAEFDQETVFKLPRELAAIFASERGVGPSQAEFDFTHPRGRILQNLCTVIASSFAALKPCSAVFQPQANCFELFGLDFLVDQNLDVHLLEFNSGPDLDQGNDGNRLGGLISSLVEGWCRLGADGESSPSGFVKCFDEEWAFAQHSTQQVS